MHMLRRLFGTQLASDLSSAKFTQIVCYISAVGFFALATWKIARLPLTEAELFFGILQMLAVVMLVICIGTLIRIHEELIKKHDSH